MTETQIAKYRTLEPYADVRGCWWREGAAIELRDWPKKSYALEPLNGPAKEILAYYLQHQNSVFQMPANPYTGPRGTLFLPEPREIPLWCAMETGWIMGNAVIAPGISFRSILWPDAGVRPVNNTAKEVAAYFADHCDETLPAEAWDAAAACVNTAKHSAAREVVSAAAKVTRAKETAATPTGSFPLTTGGSVDAAFLAKLGGDGEIGESSSLIFGPGNRVSIQAV